MPMYLRAQKGICLLPQDPSVFRRLSSEANLLAIMEVSAEPNSRAREEAAGLLSEYGLEKVAKSRAVMLSGGERRRLALALLLMQDAPVLMLDEPTTHLDLHHQVALLDLLGKLTAKTLIMTLHEVNLAARFCDRVLLLYPEGEVEHGAAIELLSEERLTRLYRHPVRAIDYEGRKAFLPE